MDRDSSRPISLDPVLVAALTELGQLANGRRHIVGLRLKARARTLDDPSARAGAIHIFKHLKHHGYSWEPDAIRTWAEANGWSEQDASLLASYARGVQSGDWYYTRPDPFGRNAIERWRRGLPQPG